MNQRKNKSENIFHLALCLLFLLSATPVIGQKRLSKKKGYTAQRIVVPTSKEYVIEGELSIDSMRLSRTSIKQLYLVRVVNGQEQIVDSCRIENKRFRFFGQAPEFAEMAFISGFDNGSIQFFLESGRIVIDGINGKFPLASLAKGTPCNDVFAAYKQSEQEVIRKIRSTKAVNDSLGSGRGAERFNAMFYANSLLPKVNTLRFVHQHLNSPVALYLMRYDLFYTFTPKVMERQFLRAIPSFLQGHPMYLELKNQVRSAGLAVGKPAPNISGLTPKGKSISLASLQGKYVLIDFWASWCGPCRREFPILKEALAYAAKSQKFVVYSYSIDSKEKDWIDCIEKNDLKHSDWLHVSTLQGWNSPAAKLFNVKGVPHTILLNPKGEVLAFDLRGEQLLDRIKKIVDGQSQQD